MIPEAILISQTHSDNAKLLSACTQALGYSPATATDKSMRQQGPSETFLSYLAAIRNQSAPVGVDEALLAHVSFGFLIFADDEEMLSVLQPAGMPFVSAETVKDGVSMAIASGTLQQWHNAIRAATTDTSHPSARTLYSKILNIFDSLGLSAVWRHYDRKTDRVGFLLEHKR
jgi:hypothetical protein